MNLYNYCSKEKYELREVLTGVYHDGGHSVASDGHLLIIDKVTEYPAEYEQKTVQKDGTIINGKYPNYNAVIPRRDPAAVVSIDPAKLKQAVETHKTNPYILAVLQSGNIKVCFDVKLLKRFFTALKSFKIKDILLYSPSHSAHGQNENGTALIMPRYYTEHNDVYDVTAGTDTEFIKGSAFTTGR